MAAFGDGFDIADDDRLRARNRRQRIRRARVVTRVKHDATAVGDHQAGGHHAEAVGGTGDEDACHALRYSV
jgi:hypothetical protein